MNKTKAANYMAIALTSCLLVSTAKAGERNLFTDVRGGDVSTSSLMSEGKYKIHANDVIFIFADLHPDLISSSATISPDALAANAEGLAKVAHAISAPSLFLTVPRNGKPGELIPELKTYATAENTIFRENADPFQVPKIVDAIKKSGKKTIIISGYTSEVAVLLTALGGIERGYRVVIPVDCIGNRSAKTEDAALARSAQAGAMLTSLASVAAELAPDFSREPGKTILSVIMNAKL